MCISLRFVFLLSIIVCTYLLCVHTGEMCFFLLDDIQVIIFHGAFKVSNKLAMLTFLSYYL